MEDNSPAIISLQAWEIITICKKCLNREKKAQGKTSLEHVKDLVADLLAIKSEHFTYRALYTVIISAVLEVYSKEALERFLVYDIGAQIGSNICDGIPKEKGTISYEGLCLAGAERLAVLKTRNKGHDLFVIRKSEDELVTMDGSNAELNSNIKPIKKIFTNRNIQ